jgi:hypothetical protein
MYQPGRSCSSCPETSTCSTKYDGICSSIVYNSGTITSSSISNGFINGNNTRTNTIISNNRIKTTNRIRSMKNSNIVSYNPREKKRIIPNISTRREPRLAEARTVPRLEADSQRRVIRQRPYRKTKYSPCRNVWCPLARLFQ